MPVLPQRPLGAAGAHAQADRGAIDHGLQVGAPGRGAVMPTAAVAIGLTFAQCRLDVSGRPAPGVPLG